MKCVHCGRDTRRAQGRCAGCGHGFALTEGPVTDLGFKHAIDAVSAAGRLRWGVEHLYYEVCRRRRVLGTKGVAMVAFALVAVLVATRRVLVGMIVVGAFLVLAGIASRLRPRKTVRVSREEFEGMWRRWQQVHGTPEGVIVRPKTTERRPAAEPDVADYSFDRAVICDRARTVDLLLANNFHFENNCAVLAVNGYPAGPFETVRAMLKRNPRLQVFALHDASPIGCRLAHYLAHDPGWFKDHVRVVDVGLRPEHAGPFRGLLLPAEAAVAPGGGVTAAEAEWLSRYSLELAAIRPEQLLKRLYKAISRKSGAGGEDETWADSTSGDGAGVDYDSDSFGTDAGDGDGGADSFG